MTEPTSTPAGRGIAERWRRSVVRRPRVWGLALAVLLFAGYVFGMRPARWWAAEHVAHPLLQTISTERARSFEVVRIARRPDAVFALPRAALGAVPADPPALDAALDAFVRTQDPPQWAAPVGVLFLLPGLFLIALFPDRPYWAWLLAYHVVLGVVAFGAFALGLAAWAPAFKLYTFARTYLAETVSLAVPLLLALAARGSRRPARVSSPELPPPPA